ncbi:hypothetical protein WME79_33705 [Sorangium sp. So ce726]|uniref:hypothetical protein n=1 Tax=Sorangium sp. So ce726 TaxID=3133319 RepID=UPI003F61777D
MRLGKLRLVERAAFIAWLKTQHDAVAALAERVENGAKRADGTAVVLRELGLVLGHAGVPPQA